MLKTRNATLSDSKKIYLWNTDPVTRSNSFSTNSFSFEEHNNWYRSKLDDLNAIFMIFTDDSNNDVGLVRINKTEEHWLIGITIDKNHRGKGYSSQMINSASKAHYAKYGQPLIAQIKQDNPASIKAFLKAGFRFDKELLINNISSSQYIYENK